MNVDTLNLVRDNNVMFAILNVLYASGVTVMSADGRSIVVKTNCLPVTITWEMCGCHGGRMWFNQKETGMHIELSSPSYDTDNGICDPQTELAYYIDKKMVDTINEFSKYVYIVDITGNYGKKDSFTRSYFKSLEAASKYVFDKDGHDLNNQFEPVDIYYPNKRMMAKVEYVGHDGDALLYRRHELKRDDVDSEWVEDYSCDIKFWMYRKDMK